MAITQTITVLPTPPSRADPANFDTRADAFLSALPTMQTQMNTWAGQANSTASAATGAAGDAEAAQAAAEAAQGTATTQAGIATTQAGIATTQAGTATTQAGTATTQAGIATTQAGIATTQAGIATTKAGEAAASAALAVDVVSGGLTSTTPAANKIPLADGAAKIALGWLDLTGYAPAADGVTNGNSHDHNGGDGGQIAYANLSGLPTLGTAAATASSDYAPAAQGVTNGNSHDHNGGDGAQIAYASLSGLPTLGTAAATASSNYAPAAQGVTNGNSHDHNGGDGGQIAYANLSGLPTLGTAAATASSDYAPAAQGVTNGNSHDHNGGDGAQIAYSSLSGTPSVREKLTADRTYYVRTDGSDANTGLADTAGGAFLTVQKAVDVVSGTLDVGFYRATISLGDGTHDNGNGISLRPWVGSVAPWIAGLSSAIVSSSSNTLGTGAATITGDDVGTWVLHGFKLVGGHDGLSISGDTFIYLRGGFDFGACGMFQVRAMRGASVGHGGGDGTGHSISGSAQAHLYLDSGATCWFRWGITLTNTPAFGTAFIFAELGSAGKLDETSFTGSATGKRYNVRANATVKGGGDTALPGNVAGTTETSGVYI